MPREQLQHKITMFMRIFKLSVHLARMLVGRSAVGGGASTAGIIDSTIIVSTTVKSNLEDHCSIVYLIRGLSMDERLGSGPLGSVLANRLSLDVWKGNRSQWKPS